MMQLKQLIGNLVYRISFIFLLFLTACSSTKKVNRDYLYFQKDEDVGTVTLRVPLIQVNDVLNIQIISKSLNQSQTELFNSRSSGSAAGAGPGYLVGLTGEIEVPVIGTVKAAGLTRVQLQALITEKLNPYIKDPSVFITLMPYNINILGEVRAPGAHSFTKERITIIDAISSAGDLTDFGNRDSIIVIREEAGKRKFYSVDLRSKSLFLSPVYQLQANDVVYVQPNDIKLKTLDIDPARQRNWQTFLSVVSLITTFISIGSFIIAVSK